ncbi:hypothetical protein ACFFRR_009230 [Megaselia abdita]
MDTTLMIFTLALLTVITINTRITLCASFYQTILLKPHFESICNHQQELFVESDGKESSLILELQPPTDLVGIHNSSSCTRILSTSDAHGFIVRLIRPKIRKPFNGHSGPLSKPSTMKQSKERNSPSNDITKSCPLSIFSHTDPTTPSLIIDPCLMEAMNNMEDPVRLFPGRLKIIWAHNSNKVASKLMITVLGKGDACQNENKHPCLHIGSEPLVCISKELVCDGIRHCPHGNEYDSDEDPKLCSNRKFDDDGLINKFDWSLLEFIRNYLPSEMHTLFPATTPSTLTTSPSVIEEKTETNNKTSNHHKKNSTRLNFSSDLSKYGPWGYLMLGMLLCGGALLICGLWASASSNSDSDTSVTHGRSSPLEQNQLPPNYEEIDPPPSYSTLFPNQKEISNEPTAGPNIVENAEASSEEPSTTTSPSTDVAVTVESVPSS